MRRALYILLLNLSLLSCTVSHKEVESPLPPLDSIGIGWGIAAQSVVDLRSEPQYRSALSTQILMGTPVKVLERSDGWSRVITPEGYVGWTLELALSYLNDKEHQEWIGLPRLIVTAHYSLFRGQPNGNSQIVADGVKGNIVVLLEEGATHYRVSLPGGVECYLPLEDGVEFSHWVGSRSLTVDSFIATAMEMLGAPYVWGGTSFKGVDCSGLTKTALFLNGAVLLRDASQQITLGKEVVAGENFSLLQRGDLLFFGESAQGGREEKIEHVAIYIGEGQILHSSQLVRINSIYPSSNNYYQNSNKFLRAKRLIPLSKEDESVMLLKNHRWYFK
ncbi:MAG: C40 family peptidase [Bacteroidales bacterium]